MEEVREGRRKRMGDRTGKKMGIWGKESRHTYSRKEGRRKVSVEGDGEYIGSCK